MSQLYRLDQNAVDISHAMMAQAGRDPWAGGYITPGQFAPVITKHQKTGRRIMRPMHWGYPPPKWNPENAMATGEAIRWAPHVRNLESPFWIGNLRHSELRCLIPATSFQLWSQNIDPRNDKKKQHFFNPNHTHNSDHDHPNEYKRNETNNSIFAIAGIWRDLTDMPVFAMLTVPSYGAAANINPKVNIPLMLAPSDYDMWLNADWKEAKKLVSTEAATQ